MLNLIGSKGHRTAISIKNPNLPSIIRSVPHKENLFLSVASASVEIDKLCSNPKQFVDEDDEYELEVALIKPHLVTQENPSDLIKKPIRTIGMEFTSSWYQNQFRSKFPKTGN